MKNLSFISCLQARKCIFAIRAIKTSRQCFLAGSNASLHTWEPLVAQLKDDYRLISFDLPGHGLTGATPQEDYSNIAMANFTREVIELYDFKSVTLVGNSMGGAVALRYALMYPRETDALVLVSSGGMERDEDDSICGGIRACRF